MGASSELLLAAVHAVELRRDMLVAALLVLVLVSLGSNLIDWWWFSIVQQHCIV